MRRNPSSQLPGAESDTPTDHRLGVPLATWIASKLSDEQKRPFHGVQSRSSILAAAGSGKTRTLVHLLAHDLCSGLPASGIVAFTFTEKAAGELLARIHEVRNRHMPTVDLSGLFVGTIHSWCLQYLHSKPEFYNVTPLDELHVDSLAARLYSYLHLDECYKKPFPKAVRPFLNDIDVFYNEHLSLPDVPPTIAPPIAAFLRVLAENRLLTFGGMIRSATEHLKAKGPLRTLEALYVDEYQDVNPAQCRLIHAMLPSTGTLRVVGDDLQSIYNWRGSDVNRILGFPGDFAPADVFRLSANYRSRPEVVAVANGVAEDIVVRDPEKAMRPVREPCRSTVVNWLSTSSEEDQAAAIVEIVQRFHGTGVPYSSIAILMRSVATAGKPIYRALQAAGIPVQCPILSRSAGFINEFLLPIVEWLRTDQTVPRNREEEREQEERADSLWRSVSKWLSIDDAENIFWRALNRWYDLLRESGSKGYNVRRCLYEFLDDCGVRIGPSDSELMVGLGLSSQIIRRVEEIHRRRLEGRVRASAVRVVTEVYYALVRNHRRFGESLPLNQHSGGVILTTVHQAKGLEWPVVLLPMLTSRRFPLSDRPYDSRFSAQLTDRYATRRDDERRLFYVAVTRARERLVMLDTAAGDASKRSVFMKDLQRRGLLPEEGLPERSSATWSIPAGDLQPGSEPPITIGLSDLLLYLECPYQFGLRRFTGIQPAVGDELGFGKGLHELLQRRADSDLAWTPQDLGAQVERHVHLPLTSEREERRARLAIGHRVTVLDHLGAFLEDVQQELPVEVFLDGGVVTGLIDFVYTLPDGSMVVRDWKASIHAQFVPRYTRQVQVYVYALRLQDNTVTGGELVDVAASAQANQLVTVDVDIREPTINRLIAECQEALHSIRACSFRPTPNVQTCGSCDVRHICAVRIGDSNGQADFA